MPPSLDVRVSPRRRGLPWITLLVLAFVCEVARGAEASSVPLELSVLSYNVRGLPEWIAKDDAKGRMRRIGERLGDYDLVLFQEDFAHHEALVADARHPTVVRGNGPRSRIPFYESCICPWCGSGLTVLAAAPPKSLLEVERVPFGSCAGRLSRRFDCWVAKGVLRVRLALAPGVEVDVYVLHLDAGTTSQDRDARRLQLAQIRDVAESASAGRAMIVGGDFNTWIEHPDDRAALEGFTEGLGLREVLDAPDRPPLDRIFRRDGAGVRLEVLDAGVDERFVDDGLPLSDHPAIRARFRLHPIEREGAA